MVQVVAAMPTSTKISAYCWELVHGDLGAANLPNKGGGPRVFLAQRLCYV
jgi:hypothetical protein